MPELPEVETYRSYLAHTVLHKKIERVNIYKPEILTFSKQKLLKLKGKSFKDTYRHGKYCFLITSSDLYLVLHFGMTGSVEYYREDDDPRFSAMVFSFTEGHKLSVISKRKLGKIYLSSDINGFIRQKNLGPDAYNISKKNFTDMVKSKRGIIKSVLMNQSSIAGIGNIYADEILYQSGLRPDLAAEKLDELDITRIYTQMKSILKKAVKLKANYSMMPKNYLLHRRKPGAKCGKDQGIIEKIEVGGRSTYFCPNHQK